MSLNIRGGATVSTRRSNSHSPTTEHTNPFCRQLDQIPQECRHLYRSTKQAADIIQGAINSFTATNSYLYFRGIQMTQVEALDKALLRRQLRGSVRITVEETTNEMILRLIPGREHGATGLEFFDELRTKIAQIPGHTRRSIVGTGATRMRVPGQRSKEGDQSISPATRSARSDPWPSVVVEVGYLETLSQLRIDAEWWLKYSAEHTRFVVLLSIALSPNTLLIECWRMLPPERQTRHNPPLIPRCEQQVIINETGNIISTNHQIHIPYNCIFDEPNANSFDVLFTSTDLSSFALWVFSQWL